MRKEIAVAVAGVGVASLVSVAIFGRALAEGPDIIVTSDATPAGLKRIVSEPQPTNNLGIRSASELKCETGVVVAGVVNNSGAELAPRPAADVDRRKPDDIADGFASGNTKRLSNASGPAKRVTFTYDRADPALARKVRIEFTTDDGALTGIVVAENEPGVGWLTTEHIACSTVVPENSDEPARRDDRERTGGSS